MTWWSWPLLATVIVLGGVAVHLWLWWRLWGKMRALGRELANVTRQVGELTDEAGELVLSADRTRSARPVAHQPTNR